MPEPRRFIEVRFDPSGAMGARQTGAQSGSFLDTIVEAYGGTGSRGGYRGVAIARNLPEVQVDRVLAGLQVQYGAPAQVIIRAPGRCVFRYEVAAAAVPDPALAVLLAFHDELGAPWIHIADGEVMLRAEAGRDPEASVRTVRKALAMAGISADVRVVELDRSALGPWHELHGVVEALKEEGALDGHRMPTTVTPGTP